MVGGRERPAARCRDESASSDVAPLEQTRAEGLRELQAHLEDVRRIKNMLLFPDELPSAESQDDGEESWMPGADAAPAFVELGSRDDMQESSRRARRARADLKRRAVYEVTAQGHTTPLEPAVAAICGVYTPAGWCCGRRVWRRAGITLDIMMYYWSSPFVLQSGWWIGHVVGGSHVWARCISLSSSPPSRGWRVPWDGAVREELTIRKIGWLPGAGARTTARR